MRKMYCDICKKDCGYTIGKIHFNIGVTSDWREMDVCRKCSEKIVIYVKELSDKKEK